MRLDLNQLLSHLLQGSLAIRPVEPHRSRPLLQSSGHQQRRQGGDQAIQDPSPTLSPLDSFPRLRCSLLEEMRVPAAHLGLELVGNVRSAEFIPLLGDDELKGQMQQEITELVSDALELSL